MRAAKLGRPGVADQIQRDLARFDSAGKSDPVGLVTLTGCDITPRPCTLKVYLP